MASAVALANRPRPRAPSQRIERESLPATLLAKPARLGLHRPATARFPRTHAAGESPPSFGYGSQCLPSLCLQMPATHRLGLGPDSAESKRSLRSIPAPSSEPLHWPTFPLRSVPRSESSETGIPLTAPERKLSFRQPPQNFRPGAVPNLSLTSG